MEEFKNIISRASGDIGITLTNREIDLLVEYYKELLLWNKKMSLVSIKSPLDIPKHFIDSLTVTKLIKNEDSKLLDIGTGAGLPGIPLKIKIESLCVTLLDSSRKKTSFLKSVIRKLGLRDISVVNSRAELLTHKEGYRGSFDIVISRAAFKIPYFLTLGEQFLSDGGTLIAMKGKNADDELEQAADTIRKTNLELTCVHEIKLPVTGESRKMLCFHKNLS
ncbi:MAG: 16S rRNA (guanine(527)-N(7))-methyltransferase RsmG [Deltaproteobacteria bacterium]|nr:16S rRNA (guanine(527)-N(7))-methyltransferase RsmG [Deltaproteobacteria bacterium]MBW2648279.1 16S rRNA (guanine(527)-N(7))-methyltransferase RsmG [Deltaproteobacteria bacterium]